MFSLFFFFFLSAPPPPQRGGGGGAGKTKCPNQQLQNSPESVSFWYGVFGGVFTGLFCKEEKGLGGRRGARKEVKLWITFSESDFCFPASHIPLSFI